MAIVITHPEQGIYLGSCLGLGFWSKLDSVGQPCACTFESGPHAESYVSSWDQGNDPALYGYVDIGTTAEEGFASIWELADAGLGHLLGDMAENDRTTVSSVHGAM